MPKKHVAKATLTYSNRRGCHVIPIKRTSHKQLDAILRWVLPRSGGMWLFETTPLKMLENVGIILPLQRKKGITKCNPLLCGRFKRPHRGNVGKCWYYSAIKGCPLKGRPFLCGVLFSDIVHTRGGYISAPPFYGVLTKLVGCPCGYYL